MKKTIFIITILFSFILISGKAYAPWIWTPDGGWMNEKDMVKDSSKTQWEYALSLEKEGKYNNAVRAYKALIKTYPTSPLAPQAGERIALCYEHEGELYEAFKTYQNLIENYPKEINFDNILKKEYRIGELFISGTKRKVFKLPIMPARDKGIDILKTVVSNAPFSEIAPQAQFKIAVTYMKMGKYTEASDAFKKLIEDYNNTPWYEESLYQAGMCDYKKSHGASYDQAATKDALKLLEKFEQEFPQSKHVIKVKSTLGELSGRQTKGLLSIARFYDSKGQYKAAIMYYNNVASKFPGTKNAEEARKRVEQLEKKLQQ